MKYRELARKSIINFDLEEMFSFLRDNSDDYGGSLLITSRQIILAANGGDGRGTHWQTFAPIMSELYSIELNNINNYNELKKTDGYEDMIYARIVNDKSGCYIGFSIKDNLKISENEFNMFMQFYNKYNKKIEELSKKIGIPLVQFYNTQTDEECYSNNLDEVKEYLRSRIDKNKKDKNEEIIAITEEERAASYKETIMDELRYLLRLIKSYKEKMILDDDYTNYEQLINEIEKDILRKSEDGYTIEEKRELMIKMAKVIDDVSMKIKENSLAVNIVARFNQIEGCRQYNDKEEYNEQLEDFLKRIGGLDILIKSIDNIKEGAQTKTGRITQGFIDYAKQKVDILRRKRGVSLLVEEMVTGETRKTMSYAEKTDIGIADIYMSRPTRTEIKKIIQTLEEQVNKCSSEEEKYNIYDNFIKKYKSNYSNKMIEYFKNRLIKSIEKNVKNNADKLIDYIRNSILDLEEPFHKKAS